MSKGEKMGQDSAVLVFGAAFVLFIVAIVIWMRRETNDGAEAAQIFKSSQLQVQAVNEKYAAVVERIDTLTNSQKDCTMVLAELQHKYEALLEKSQKIEVTAKPQNIKVDVQLRGPLKVETDKPFMMEFSKPVPVYGIKKKSKTPLLERAGITDDKKTNKKGK